MKKGAKKAAVETVEKSGDAGEANYSVGDVLMSENAKVRNPVLIYGQDDSGFKLVDETHHALVSTFTSESLAGYGYRVIAHVEVNSIEVKPSKHTLVTEETEANGEKVVKVRKIAQCAACEGKGVDSKGKPCPVCTIAKTETPASVEDKAQADRFKDQPDGWTIAVEPKTAKVGETVEVRFVCGSFQSLESWIGLIPADAPHDAGAMANDNVDVWYTYLSTVQKIMLAEGRISVRIPKCKAGAYTFRIHTTDEKRGVECASCDIELG